MHFLDKAADKAKIKLSNSSDVFLIKAGQRIFPNAAFKAYSVTAEAIKDTDSDLTTGLKVTLFDAKGEKISETIKNY